MSLEGMLRSPVVSIDLETTGFNWRKADIQGVSFAWLRGEQIVGAYVRDLVLSRLLCERLLKSSTIQKVGWNLKFDLHFLRTKLGLGSIPLVTSFWDGMIASRLLDENTDNELKSSSERLFGTSTGLWEDQISWGPKMKKGKLRGKPRTPSDSPLWDYYGANDAILSLMHWKEWHQQIAYEFPHVFKLEMELLPCVLEMEERGMKIDTDYLSNLLLPKSQGGGGLRDELHNAYVQLEQLAPGLNPNSPDQVSELLFGKLKLKPRAYTEKGKPSAREEALRAYATVPEVKAILAVRELEKLITNFVEGILTAVDGDGYIHAKFNQMGARSGRFSSSEPNLQNIVRGPLIRRAFLADPWLFDNDAVQVEARLFAHFAFEPTFIRAFEAGFDIHAATYADLFRVPIDSVTEPQRKRAKTVNFGIMYGSGAEKQANVLGISKNEAKAFLDDYYRRYPAVRLLQRKVREAIEERGYIRLPSGRKLRLPKEKAYVGVNRLIQGCAADVMKMGMLRLYKEFPFFPQRLSVHDEIAWDYPIEEDPRKWEPRVREALEDIPGFRPAIKWDTRSSKKNWGDLKNWPEELEPQSN